MQKDYTITNKNLSASKLVQTLVRNLVYYTGYHRSIINHWINNSESEMLRVIQYWKSKPDMPWACFSINKEDATITIQLPQELSSEDAQYIFPENPKDSSINTIIEVHQTKNPYNFKMLISITN